MFEVANIFEPSPFLYYKTAKCMPGFCFRMGVGVAPPKVGNTCRKILLLLLILKLFGVQHSLGHALILAVLMLCQLVLLLGSVAEPKQASSRECLTQLDKTKMSGLRAIIPLIIRHYGCSVWAIEDSTCSSQFISLCVHMNTIDKCVPGAGLLQKSVAQWHRARLPCFAPPCRSLRTSGLNPQLLP